MTTAQLRRQIKKQVDALPEEKLTSAADFLSYLEDRYDEQEQEQEQEQDASYKQLFLDQIAEAERDVAEGRMTPWREVRNDV